MDPTACLEDIFSYLEEGDCEEAQHSMVNLVTWLSNGGFLPNFPDSPDPLTPDGWRGVQLTLSRWIESARDLERERYLEAQHEDTIIA